MGWGSVRNSQPHLVHTHTVTSKLLPETASIASSKKRFLSGSLRVCRLRPVWRPHKTQSSASYPCVQCHLHSVWLVTFVRFYIDGVTFTGKFSYQCGQITKFHQQKQPSMYLPVAPVVCVQWLPPPDSEPSGGGMPPGYPQR